MVILYSRPVGLQSPLLRNVYLTSRGVKPRQSLQVKPLLVSDYRLDTSKFIVYASRNDIYKVIYQFIQYL